MLRHLNYRSPFFRNADTGGSTGSAPVNLTIAEQLSAARNDLKAALDKSGSDAAEVKRLKDENTRLQSDFDQMTKAQKDTADKLAKATTDFNAEVTAHNATKATLDTAQKNVSRIEKLASARGLSLTEAAPAVDDPSNGASLLEQYSRATGPARRALYSKHGAEIRAEQKLREVAAR